MKTGYIGMLAVQSSYRRKGIGKALVRKVLQRMKSMKCESVMLETGASDEKCYLWFLYSIVARQSYHLSWHCRNVKCDSPTIVPKVFWIHSRGEAGAVLLELGRCLQAAIVVLDAMYDTREHRLDSMTSIEHEPKLVSWTCRHNTTFMRRYRFAGGILLWFSIKRGWPKNSQCTRWHLFCFESCHYWPKMFQSAGLTHALGENHDGWMDGWFYVYFSKFIQNV